jgi:hypothetical protein
MQKLIALLLVSFIITTTTNAAENTINSTARQKGEMVTVGGKERPDLIELFDTLKEKVVLVKGVASNKPQEAGDAHATATDSSDLTNQAKQSVAKGEREQEIKNSNSTPQYCVPRCLCCGNIYCTNPTPYWGNQ